MKKDEKLIAEKLNTFAEYTPSDNDVEMPEELRTQLNDIVHSIPTEEVNNKANTEKKRKIRNFSLIGAASAVACAVIICCAILIPKNSAPDNGETKYYHDSDLTANVVEYDSFIADFDVLIPNLDYTDTTITVSNYNKSNRSIYSNMKLYTQDGKIVMTVVFVNNYDIIGLNNYTSLPDTGTTDLVSYSYRVIAEAGRAFAAFEYNNYRYYVDYTSDYPEDIEYIISTLELK